MTAPTPTGPTAPGSITPTPLEIDALRSELDRANYHAKQAFWADEEADWLGYAMDLRDAIYILQHEDEFS